MSKDLISVITAGLVSGGLFLVVFGMGLGFLFMFLPTLPLFSVGLGKYPRLTFHAGLIAAGIVALIAGPVFAMLFLLFFALPAYYLTQQSLRKLPDEEHPAWYPLGLALTQLTLYACGVVAAMTLYYYFWGAAGGLPALLAQNIYQAFQDLEPEYSDVLRSLANDWSFLVFSITIWLWGLALYGHGWLAHRALVNRQMNQRPDFAITPFTMPGWMLSLLAICGLSSLIGSISFSFLGKTTLISLMLPYFLAGAALLHKQSESSPNRRFLLFFMYLVILAQFWPALIVSGIGLWDQIKHLSGRGTWSKS